MVKSSKAKPARRVVSLALTARAEQVVSEAKQQTGITQVAFLERLLEWYATQDARVRTMVLSPYPQVRQGLARLILEEMQAHPTRDYDQLFFDELIDHDFTTGDARPEVAAILQELAPRKSKVERRRR